MVAAIKETFPVGPEFSIVHKAASSHVAERAKKPVELSAYLPELFTGTSSESTTLLDSQATDIIRATWAGMTDEEIAIASETDANAIKTIRRTGYALLGVSVPVTPTGTENHLGAVSKALESKSFDFSDLIEKERINVFPSLHPREVEEAKRFIAGDDVTKIPQGGAFNPEVFQRRLLHDTVTEKLGKTPAEVALHVAIAEHALRLSRAKESPKVPHPIFPSAA